MPTFAVDHFSCGKETKQSWREAGFPLRKLTLRPAIAPPGRRRGWPNAQFTPVLLRRAFCGRSVLIR